MRLSIKLLLMLAAVLAFATGSWWLATPSAQTTAAGQENSKAERGARYNGQRAVPVLAAMAERKDAPIIVRGIGSVQAFNKVTIRSLVDGNIVKAAFAEGPHVHKGDLLTEIDRRPHQAQLEQAEANKAKDQISPPVSVSIRALLKAPSTTPLGSAT